MDIANLLPGKEYLLKWSSVKMNGRIHNMIVLKGKFIKYNDSTYCEEYKRYNDSDEAEIPEAFKGTILTDEGNSIIYPFVHPLYPYSRMVSGRFNGCNLGLFRIISVVNSVFKGVKGNFKNDPYTFVTLRETTLLNTPGIEYTTPSGTVNNGTGVVNNETLMWVDLNKVKLIPAIDRLLLLQEKALDALYHKSVKEIKSKKSSSLPDYLPLEIIKRTAKYVGRGRKHKQRTKRRRTHKA